MKIAYDFKFLSFNTRTSRDYYRLLREITESQNLTIEIVAESNASTSSERLCKWIVNYALAR